MSTQEHNATVKALSESLRDVFGELEDSKRLIDVTRIPLICKSIIDTNTKINEINNKLDTKFVTVEAFLPVQKLVYGLVGIILLAVVGALVGLVVMR